MELTTRPRLDSDQRCPYCHDHLEVQVEAAITCPACGTEHHAECVRELGRCATMGCERRLDLLDSPAAADPAVRRSVRQRYRDRAKRFVFRNVRRAGAGVEGQVADLEQGWEELLRAVERQDREHALALWGHCQRLWRRLPVRSSYPRIRRKREVERSLRAASWLEEPPPEPASTWLRAMTGLRWGLGAAGLLGPPLVFLALSLNEDLRHLLWALPLLLLIAASSARIGYVRAGLLGRAAAEDVA